jgi:hypothetical protein
MPDVWYKTVKSITQPPRLVEISTITTVKKVIKVRDDGSHVPQPDQTDNAIVQKWSVKAMVEQDWAGTEEEEFFFPSLAEAQVIQPGYKRPM